MFCIVSFSSFEMVTFCQPHSKKDNYSTYAWSVLNAKFKHFFFFPRYLNRLAIIIMDYSRSGCQSKTLVYITQTSWTHKMNPAISLLGRLSFTDQSEHEVIVVVAAVVQMSFFA